MSPRVYLGFLPWVVFAFVGRAVSGGVTWGAVAALGTAVLIVASSARNRSVRLLEVSAIPLFGAFVIAGALNQHDPQGFLQVYFRAIAAVALALIALVSTRFTPLTEPYGRELVSKRFWATPRFRQVNAAVTLIWSTTFFAVALSFMAAGMIASNAWTTVFNWIVPVGLTLLGVRTASRLWNDEYDADSMTLDAMLDQTDLWEFSE